VGPDEAGAWVRSGRSNPRSALRARKSAASSVNGFFYGLFMDVAVLRNSGAIPGDSRRNRRLRPVAGVCLIVLHVPDGVQPPSLDTLHSQLDPALDYVGYQLAQIAERVAPRHPEDGASDLEWLFEVSAPVVQGEVSQATQDRGERLSTMMAASVAHLRCVLGALLVPERQLRIVRVADASRHTAEEMLRQLESPMLNWVQRKNQPMVVNKPVTVNRAGAAGSPQSPLRILAVPVTGHASVPEGVLVLLRAMDAPEFSRRVESADLGSRICVVLADPLKSRRLAPEYAHHRMVEPLTP